MAKPAHTAGHNPKDRAPDRAPGCAPDLAADLATLRDWFAEWGRFVAVVDFDSARRLFDADVIGFGTWMNVVEGLDHLVEAQWQSIWPTIEGFRFELDSLQARVSPDRLFAVAVGAWDSTGFAEDGTPYPRPGRATVAFRRESLEAPWRAVHTHLSLNRGVPQQSFGPGSGPKPPPC